MDNEQLNLALKKEVTAQSSRAKFVHHEWFVTYHLEIVEQIARELCTIYKNADPIRVNTLVWLHDFEKIVDFDNQYNTEQTATKELMKSIGYSDDAIQFYTQQINIYNAKIDLVHAPIETQIVSSADAASHLVGPFITLYWYENPDKSITELQSENRRKLNADWEKKVTLPEIKAAFASRRLHVMEISGELPEKYL
jgi:hypothetical protein